MKKYILIKENAIPEGRTTYAKRRTQKKMEIHF
jgi:hypothetical protein